MIDDHLVIIFYVNKQKAVRKQGVILDENIVNEMVRRKIVSDTFRRLNSVKKEKLYLGGLLLFGKYGYDGLSVDKFCVHTRISKGSFFQYFPSKAHLLEFILLLFDKRLMMFIQQIKQGDPKILAKDRIGGLILALTSRGRLDVTEKIFYHFASNALYHSAVTVEGINIPRHLNNYVNDIIKRGIETGEVRGDYSPTVTGAIVATALNAVLTHYFLRNIQPDESTV
ncbi:MAG: TetR/AcrR family transcriptional regulator, partial [Candidatus Zixiibacteriota bacterium]